MSRKILVIDDDVDIVAALTTVLQASGYEVATAGNGVEGLVQLQLQRPDMIILDLLMPRMDGFAFCNELGRGEFRYLPILVLTALREESTRRQFEAETGRTLGPDRYIDKPFIVDSLLRKVENALVSTAESMR